MLSAPLYIEMEITKECQLRCEYCSAFPLGGGHASADRLIEAILEMKTIGVFSLLLSGGEPTVHPSFLRIMEAAYLSVPSIMLNTNGIRMSSEAFLEEFLEVCPSAMVAVSLDSIDPEINNRHRGAGGHKAIIAIQNCSKLGVPVAISTVITESNVDSAHLLIERFFPSVKIFRFFPRTSSDLAGVRRYTEKYISKLDMLYRKMQYISEHNADIQIITPHGDAKNFGTCRNSSLETKCVCINTKLFINRHLDVFPCFYSAAPEFKLGSLRTGSIADLWNGEKISILRRQSGLVPCAADTLQSIPRRYA